MTLLAALAMSPGSKAITEIDEKLRLVVADYPEHFSVSLIDLNAGDVIRCNDEITGLNSLQSWVTNCVFDVDIDLDEKRWHCLEETLPCQRCAER